jgi:membrane-bound metal-dependent hydrolase YbcI (DUF457 family)
VPVTPFHFGPGLLLGLVGRKNFSLGTFMAVNVVIDVESGWHLATHAYPVHTFLHTALGASLAALVVAPTWWFARRRTPAALGGPRPVAPRAAALGAALGAWSHVVLDGIMHGDVRPLAPWSAENPLLHLVPLADLHSLCIGAGLVGAVGMLVLGRRR